MAKPKTQKPVAKTGEEYESHLKQTREESLARRRKRQQAAADKAKAAAATA